MRELIGWDAKAEAAVQAASTRFQQAGMAKADADREAGWVVELDLCRKWYRGQLEKAWACKTGSEKKALFAVWVREFGKSRAETLAQMAKSEDGKFREAVSQW
ncbi:MAG: hypothetical protein ACMV0I_01700 [Pseudomonas sp.]